MQWCIPVGNRSSATGNTSQDDEQDVPTHFRRMLTTMASSNSTTYELEFDGASTFQTIGSLVSIASCVFIMASYLLFPPLRRYHSNFVIWIALMGVLYHGSVLTQTQPYMSCCSTAPVTQVSLLAQEFYFFVLAFNFYYTTKYPFLSTRYLVPLYHIFVWFVVGMSAYIASTMAVGSISSYGFCWFSGFSSKAENTLLVTFIIPMASCLALCVGWYYVATKRVRLSGSSIHTSDARTNLETMRKYLVWSSIYWALVMFPWLARHKDWVQLNSPEEKALRFFGRMTMALKGLLTAVVWARIMNMSSAYKVWKNGTWDEYMKVHEATWVMRRQILYYATKGIQFSASLTAEQSQVNEETMRPGSSVSRSSGMYPWDTRLDACHDGGPSVISYELQGPTTDSKAIFRDFHPSSFQEIRRLSGITGESYIRSFAGRTKERFSEGKSGSFLYYTGDQLFILKTCTPSEQRYLLQILPQYMNHLRDNPNSYLCRYVGCHEIVMEHHSVSFIVLTNILNNTTVNVDEFYDLKGSWVGRFRALTRKGTKRVCKYCGRDYIVGMSKEGCERNPSYGGGHGELIVGKDINWGNRRLRLPDELSSQLGAQLYADSEFLRRMNSMDYSLIIGLSRFSSFTFTCSDDLEAGVDMDLKLSNSTKSEPSPAVGDTCEAPGFFDTTYAQAASPVPSRARDLFPNDATVVSMGIIDILTPWSVRKSLEHWMRVYLQCRDRSGVSCVNPTMYAERFRQNVVDVVVYGNSKRDDRGYSRQQNKDFIMVDFANTGTPILLHSTGD